MKTVHHENVWGLSYGLDVPYSEFTSLERTVVDFRLNLPEDDRSHLDMQYGIKGIGRDMVSSPHAKAKLNRLDQERIAAILLELKTQTRI